MLQVGHADMMIPRPLSAVISRGAFKFSRLQTLLLHRVGNKYKNPQISCHRQRQGLQQVQQWEFACPKLEPLHLMQLSRPLHSYFATVLKLSTLMQCTSPISKAWVLCTQQTEQNKQTTQSIMACTQVTQPWSESALTTPPTVLCVIFTLSYCMCDFL